MIEVLIVDGYNVIHAVPALEHSLKCSLKKARSLLEEALRQYQSKEKSIKRVYVVYDSRANTEKRLEDLGLIKNIFVSSSSNADSEIVSLLKSASKTSNIAVLSRDNFVMNHTRAMGANILPIDAFCRKLPRHDRAERKTEIDESEKEEINRELRRLWGIK